MTRIRGFGLALVAAALLLAAPAGAQPTINFEADSQALRYHTSGWTPLLDVTGAGASWAHDVVYPIPNTWDVVKVFLVCVGPTSCVGTIFDWFHDPGGTGTPIAWDSTCNGATLGIADTTVACIYYQTTGTALVNPSGPDAVDGGDIPLAPELVIRLRILPSGSQTRVYVAGG